MRKIFISLMIAVALFLSGCVMFGKTKSLTEKAEESLQLSLEETTVLEEWDTHGGFHGDGESFLKLSCPDGFEEKLGACWQAFPLEGAAYQYFYEWGGVLEHPETGEKVIPEIVNGFWYFQDTGAMNWEFAVFDCEENILYFYVWDA